MCKVIAISNQRGGVGKTTTSIVITDYLLSKGKKVLVVDLDPQGNLTDFYLPDDNPSGKTIFDVLAHYCNIRDAITILSDNLSIIRSSANLTQLQPILDSTNAGLGKEYVLKEKVAEISKHFDYILIDTSPALSILSVLALTACSILIIPTQIDAFSLESIKKFSSVIKAVQTRSNEELKVKGILITRFYPNQKVSKLLIQDFQKLASQMGTIVFESKIREATGVRLAQANKKSLLKDYKDSVASKDYILFLEEAKI